MQFILDFEIKKYWKNTSEILETQKTHFIIKAVKIQTVYEHQY